MYKLVALDLDGTLLNARGEVSLANIAALRRYEAMGGIVTLCSGRSPENMVGTIKRIGLKSKYHVAMLGNQVFTLEKKYPVSYEFTNAQRDALIDALDQMNVDYLFGSEKYTVYKRACDFVKWDYETHCSCDAAFIQGDPKQYDHMFKCDAYSDEAYWYKKMWEEIDVEGVNKYRSHGTYVDFFPKRANKYEGVNNVALILGIPSKDIMAMGDAEIDRDMISGFGFGVAVANAEPELLPYADRHCDYTNNEDAVARALYKFVFKEPFPEATSIRGK